MLNIVMEADGGTPPVIKPDATPAVPPVGNEATTPSTTPTPNTEVNTTNQPSEEVQSKLLPDTEITRYQEDEIRTLTGQVVDAKIDTVNETVAHSENRAETITNFQPGERALYVASLLAEGFSEETYKNQDGSISINPDGGGLAAKSVEGNDVTISAITGQKTEVDPTTGSETVTEYSCVVDPVNPDKTVNVPVREIVRSHLANNAEEIAKTFSDTKHGENLQTIVAWGLSKDEGEIPAQVQEAMKKEDEPMVKADRIIETQIQTLQAKIEKATGEEEKAELRKLHAQLEMGLKADGEVGAWTKKKALEKIAGGELQPDEAQTLADVMNDLDPQADQAEQKLDQVLAEKGMNQDEIQKLLHGGIDAVLNNSELMSIENIDELIFGQKMTDADLQGMADKVLSEEQKKTLKDRFGDDYLKKVGKGLLWTLVIAIGVPIAASLAATALAAATAATAAKQ